MASESLEERKPEEEALAEDKGEKGGKGSSEKDRSVTKRRSRGSAEKKEKDPFTPVSNRPTREWKLLERYSVPETGRSSGTKPLSIERVLVFGSIGSVGGGLAVCKECPLVHTGACIASLL